MAVPRSGFARKRQTTQRAILEATSLLIAEKGVDGFTLSEVAQRAAVNRALIYHYFQNRDNLVDHAIDFIIDRYQPENPELSGEAVERAVRMHIAHPEIARFFFQMLLHGRPLGRLGRRMTDTIALLQQFQQAHVPGATYDAAFALIILVLAQLSWAFAREEIARLLDLSPTEADERFVAQIRSSAEQGIEQMMTPPANEEQS